MGASRGLFTIDATALLEAPATVVVERLADGLWTASTGTYRTVFVEANASVIACNTFGTPAATRALRDAIAATVPGKQIGTVIARIDHLDHSGFGAELAPDADVVAHRLTAEVIAGRSASGQGAATQVVDGNGERLEIDGVEALAVSGQQAFANGVPIWELEAMQAFCADALREEWGDLNGFEEHVGLGALRVTTGQGRGSSSSRDVLAGRRTRRRDRRSRSAR